MGERENGRARGRHARGEGAPTRMTHENRFNSHSVSADISNWSRGSRGKKFPRRARKLSINSTWQRSEGLILRYYISETICPEIVILANRPVAGVGKGGGGYCHIWVIEVCATVKCMVFKQFTLG